MDYRSAPNDIGQIAWSTLRGDQFFPFETMREAQFGRALARYGWGADYLAGDVVFAVSVADGYLHRKTSFERWASGAFFFSNRMVVGCVNGTTLFVPYADILDVRADNSDFLGSGGVALRLTNGVLKPWLPTHAAMAFFQALLAMPPDQRVAAPRPIEVHATPEDPIGAAAAERALFSSDPRIVLLLRVGAEWHRRGWLPPTTADAFVRRVHLLDRTLKMGRGMNEGMWLSSLGTVDLVGAIANAIGSQPRAYAPGPPATFDFAYGAGGVQGVAGELATDAALDFLTDGWLGTSKTVRSAHARVDGLRLVVDEQPGATRFQLVTPKDQQWVPLGRIAEVPLDDIVHAVTQVEATTLLGRLLLGFEQPYAGIAAIPRQELERILAQTIGPMDLGAFFPGFFDAGD